MNIHRTLHVEVTSLFIPLVNKVIEGMVEGGIVDKVVRDYVDPTGHRFINKPEETSLEIYEPLGLLHVFSSFLYLFLGYILSAIAFFIEIVIYQMKPKGNKINV